MSMAAVWPVMQYVWLRTLFPIPRSDMSMGLKDCSGEKRRQSEPTRQVHRKPAAPKLQ
jgi:hypothetical protein